MLRYSPKVSVKKPVPLGAKSARTPSAVSFTYKKGEIIPNSKDYISINIGEMICILYKRNYCQ